jgi:hypothetical protein
MMKSLFVRRTDMRRAVMLVLAISTSPLLSAGAQAQDPPVVVELFTSQSCSSCPPADAFLTDLAQERPDVLPLAFHVTYWNGLGWKDPFSFEAATARQRDYARSLGDRQVYTPEMVVNGARAFVGSDRTQGLAEISKAARSAGMHIPLHLTRDGQTLVIAVGPGTDHATILLVGFDPEHRTPIGRGENSGRTLLESNIVRSLTVAGQWTGSATEVREAVPAGEHFAVMLQSDDGRILSATILDGSGS